MTAETADGGTPARVRAQLIAGEYAAACTSAEAAIAAGPPSPALHAALLLDWVRAATATGGIAGAEDRLVEALELLPPGEAPQLAQEIGLELARVYVLQGNLRQGLSLSQQIGAEAAAFDSALVQARADSIAGWSLMRMHRFKEAVEALETARGVYLQYAGSYGESQCEQWYAWALIGAGDIERGIALSEGQLALLEQQDINPYALSTVLNTLSFGEFSRGNLRRVEELSQRKLEVETRIGSKPRIQIMLHNMGLLAIRLGDFAEAREHLLRCLTLSQELPDQRFVVEVAKLLSLVALHAGEPAQALDYARLGQDRLRALGLDTEHTYDWYLAPALLAAGYTDTARETWARRQSFDESHENWFELQMLRSALDAVSSPGFPHELQTSEEIRAVAAGWLAELLEQQARMPRPAAADSGQIYGTIAA